MTSSESVSSEQRRRFSRVLFHASGRLSVAGASVVCEVCDLSLKGALVRLVDELSWPVGSEIGLELNLDGKGDTVIRMSCSLVYQTGAVIGLYCRQIDLDSITHLRRLLMLNVADDALLQRELSALIDS